jgi:hypothetical protein
MRREKLLQRAQAVAQFTVVAKAALDVAVQAKGAAVTGAEPLRGTATLAAPGGVVAIHPEVDDIDGTVTMHVGEGDRLGEFELRARFDGSTVDKCGHFKHTPASMSPRINYRNNRRNTLKARPKRDH